VAVELRCPVHDDIGYVQHNRQQMDVLFTLLLAGELRILAGRRLREYIDENGCIISGWQGTRWDRRDESR
jgi:hypothetical protein